MQELQNNRSHVYRLASNSYALPRGELGKRFQTSSGDMSVTNFCCSASRSSPARGKVCGGSDPNAGRADVCVTSDCQQRFSCLARVSNSLLHWLQSDQSFHSSTSFITHFLTFTHFTSAPNCFFLIFSISAPFNHSRYISISFSFFLSTQHQHPVIYSFPL